MRDVQKCTCAGASLRGRNSAPLCCIKLDTATDQAAGTGGMLSTANNYIRRFNPTADIRLFSQEVNPESYAMCLAEMLIRGQNAENVRLQDTMQADCFPDTKMRFVLENPPFGQPWGGKDAPEGDEIAVKTEVMKGNRGRFPAGTPSSGDMQLLFIQSAMDKLDDKCGRAAIIENGSHCSVAALLLGNRKSGDGCLKVITLKRLFSCRQICFTIREFPHTYGYYPKTSEKKEREKFSL